MKGNDSITSIRKKHTIENLFPSSGAKRVGMFHEASAGETGIDLTSLSMPSSYSGKGYSNPDNVNIALLRISYFKNNIKIISTDRGILAISDFTIASNTQINFDGFTSNASEIFEIWFEPSIVTGASIVDARPLVKTYLLPEGDTDIPVEAFEINKNPLEQIGSVMVFRGPTMNLQLRNSGNATASPLADGNYEEVKATSGLSNIIRFNVPAAVGGENVTIISVGSLTERPTESMIGYLENLNGDLEVIRNTIAALSGQPKSNFDGQPVSVDLASFGERFNAILNTEITIPIFEDWQSISPTWVGTVTNPTLGNGSLTARYLRRGLVATVELILIGGTTTTAGSGGLYFTFPLPIKIDASSPKYSYLFNNVGGNLTQFGVNIHEVKVTGTGGVTQIRFFNTASGYYSDWSNTFPFAFGNLDELRLYFEIPIQNWNQNETKTLREMAGL